MDKVRFRLLESYDKAENNINDKVKLLYLLSTYTYDGVKIPLIIGKQNADNLETILVKINEKYDKEQIGFEVSREYALASIKFVTKSRLHPMKVDDRTRVIGRLKATEKLVGAVEVKTSLRWFSENTKKEIIEQCEYTDIVRLKTFEDIFGHSIIESIAESYNYIKEVQLGNLSDNDKENITEYHLTLMEEEVNLDIQRTGLSIRRI